MTKPLRQGERDRLIDRILASKGGIYGVEVCQLCGQLGSYRGYYVAVGSHLAGREFVSLGHGHPNNLGRRAELQRAQEHRWCEVYGTKAPRSKALHLSVHWLCAGCAADPAKRDEGATYPLSRLVRRRYLERLSDEELRQWAGVRADGR